MSLSLEFCGEWFHIDPGEPFLVGREGPLELDDNQYLHRRFLVDELLDKRVVAGQPPEPRHFSRRRNVVD